MTAPTERTSSVTWNYSAIYQPPHSHGAQEVSSCDDARVATSDRAVDIEPDTKDWTWVLQHPCSECGFDSAALHRERIGEQVRANALVWHEVLAAGEATRARPAPQVWSPLEYACHVRDVLLLFGDRLRLMLDQDDPQFANWDQDETAVQERYGEQDPASVSVELAAAAATTAAGFDAVTGDQWQRPGRRSNGSVFTVDTLGRYFLHDLVHHAHDVAG